MTENKIVLCFPFIHKGKVVGNQFLNPLTGEWEYHGTGHSVMTHGEIYYPVLPTKRKLLELQKAIQTYLEQDLGSLQHLNYKDQLRNLDKK
jgi:hypothetical protein